MPISDRKGGYVRPGYDPLIVADAPTIGTLSNTGATSLSLAFTAPSNVGGGAITSYAAIATDSSSGATFVATGASSPLAFTGLTTGNTYTAQVIAINAYGPSRPSSASNSAVPAVIQGQQEYTSPGTYSWIAPTGVTSISAVIVGAGGQGGSNRGGGGGGLCYKNNMTVSAGTSYTVTVGTSTTSSAVAGEGTSKIQITGSPPQATGGTSGTISSPTGGSGSNGDGNYTGGTGSNGSTPGGGGGGAAGYSGNGGNGGNPSSAGSGGGAGGGVDGKYYDSFTRISGGSGGGGVGLDGEGASGGSQSQISTGTQFGDANQPGGYGGSGGANGQDSQGNGNGGTGGLCGGGGGGGGSTISSRGGYGGVRIIWPGDTRYFPSTNTADV